MCSNEYAQERRKHRRLELQLPIAFEILEHNTKDCSINFAKTKNVSTGGTYFEFTSDLELEVDTKLKIVFDTPSSPSGLEMNNILKSPKIETVARVLRIDYLDAPDTHAEVSKRRGVAVQFDEDLKILF